jgi:hypothetical protein
MNESNDRPMSTASIAYGGDGKETDGAETEGESRSVTQPSGTNMGDMTPLVSEQDSASYQERWQTIQTRFVDTPQESVKEADALVAEVVQKVAQKFAEERNHLEGEWSKGSEVSTEDLRQAMQHYRSFFHRLLAA